MALRQRRICLTDDFFNKRLNALTTHLINRGYKRLFNKQEINKVPLIPALPNINHIISGNLNILNSSQVNSTSLCNKHIQNFLILLYKSLFFTHFPTYMKNMFSLRSSSYDLRGNYILSLSKPKTTTYGLNSFSYFSAKQWNALPDFPRNSFFADFKSKIQDVTFMQILFAWHT